MGSSYHHSNKGNGDKCHIKKALTSPETGKKLYCPVHQTICEAKIHHPAVFAHYKNEPCCRCDEMLADIEQKERQAELQARADVEAGRLPDGNLSGSRPREIRPESQNGILEPRLFL
ncbi:hypothetical protein WAI453_011207 [Rhynchosporium graminicola]